MANWFITGVSGGLGKALAQALLARGDHVFGTVRGLSDADAFEALSPPLAKAYLLDVRDAPTLTQAITSAEQASGGLDVLVNNAGYGLVGAVEESSLDEVRNLFEVNTFAPLTAIQAVLPFMRARRRGHIVNISSVSGLATWAGTGLYCASKFALEAIGETLAAEVEEFGIRVINIAPGGMRTDYAGRSMVATRTVIPDYENRLAHAAAKVMAEHAGHEPGEPAHIAQVILDVVASPNPPLHLLMGADAMKYATTRQDSLRAEFDAWSSVTLSAGTPG